MYVFRGNNLGGYLVLSIFTAIEYVCFVLVIIFLLQNKSLLKVVKLTSLAFIIFCLLSLTLSNNKFHFDSVQSSISSLLIIIFCIFYFYEKLNEPQLQFIYSEFHFWIILGFLIYLSATLFLYVYVTSLPELIARKFWVINSFSNILKNVLFSIAIIIYIKTPITKKPSKFTSI